ncbi:Imm32 family immunity protein [Solimicrobium silvestre]|uniref:Uncharacterized protein n=1 Tax=Solimicrobium silvestre TaxID=2099400 RepID=A0A2S9GXE1_9BURK|nr:hypothetical protein [Solimicrobium silvestre]PRC92383.1 hypothetical protein S2091_3042 [Solimicrobium silvestre]
MMRDIEIIMNSFFKIFCHVQNENVIDGQPSECTEVSFQATPEIFRAVAAFLIECADKVEVQQICDVDHFHLQDQWKEWKSVYPDVIVFPVKNNLEK